MFGKIFVLIIIFQICSPAEDGQIKDRIHKGVPCTYENYLFAVTLYRSEDRGTSATFRRICSATLLSIQWILTAAHCLKDHRTRKYKISIIRSNEEPDVKSWFNVQIIFLHPQFDVEAFSYYNDIALGRLDNEVEFNDYVQAVQLPAVAKEVTDYLEPSSCAQGNIMGWGKKETPRCALVPIVPIEKCINLQHGSFTFDDKKKMQTSQFCTVSDEGVNPCELDDGGPLVCGGLQIGIISWGSTCGKAPAMGIYTRLDRQLKFIRNTMRTQIGRSDGISWKHVNEILLIFLFIFNFALY